MAKYFLKLGEKEIPRISKLTITPFFRSETRKTTLSGGLAIDRGDVKKRIEATVKIMSADELRELELTLGNITVEAEFYYLNELTKSTFITEPVMTKDEIYIYNDRSKGVYYVNIKFTMEEQ